MSATWRMVQPRAVWRRLGPVLLAVVTVLSPGLSPGQPGPVYDIWPIDEGWAPTAVTSIVQSRDGYIWLGTYHGLVRYDGVRFVSFDSTHTSGLVSSRITALHQDRDGNLWIGHETGQVTCLDDGVFRPVKLAPAWPGGAIEAIAEDATGDIWILNDMGILSRLRDALILECPGGANPSRKATMHQDSAGRLWVTGNGRVASLNSGTFAEFTRPDASPNDFLELVTSARDEGLWVLANGHVRKWSQGDWLLDLGEAPWGTDAVTAMLETRAGMLLAGTLNSGLFLFAPGGEILHFSRTNGLSQDWVRSLAEDHEGTLWIGTGAGLDTLRVRSVKMLDAPDSWQGRLVLSAASAPDGGAWVGTEGAGLYHYNEGAWTTYASSSGLSNLFIWSVLLTRAGDLYVGTWGGGVAVLKDGRFQSPGELATLTAPVVCLYEGQNGEIWVGTTGGIFRYEKDKLTWSAGKNELAMADVRAITQSPDGTVWFGMSGGGLGRLQNGILKQFRKQDGIASDFILSLFVESDGTLWFGTADNGLGRWKARQFAVINPDNGLGSSMISQISDDGLGNFWLGSNRGILRVSKAGLHQCADGQTKSVQCFSYGKAEGLASLNCLGRFQTPTGKNPEGILWFPTAKGIATVDPRRVASNAAPPPVVIEDLTIDGRSMNLSGDSSSMTAIHLPPGSQRLEIRYTGLSFKATDKVRFRYKLAPLEREWFQAGTKRIAEYSYLPPGSYRFSVIACNNDEVWNETGASLGFAVLPHFWQTWWFRALSIASGAGATAGIVFTVMRRRVRRKLDRLEHQRAVERERARIARDIHDELGAGLTRITLLSQSARSELPDHQPAVTSVDQIYANARELTRAMDEIVWAVNPKHDTLDSLATYLGRYAQQFLSATAIRCRLDVPVNVPPMVVSAEVRHNLFLAFKEALNNVVKHARATEVRISLSLRPSGFVLTVSDNGIGFDPKLVHAASASPSSDGMRLASGNGFCNMQKRLDEIGGACHWEAAPNEGARVKFTITFSHHSQT